MFMPVSIQNYGTVKQLGLWVCLFCSGAVPENRKEGKRTDEKIHLPFETEKRETEDEG
jgi:hypothetical protein